MTDIPSIVRIIQSRRFSLSDEKRLQAEMAEVFTEAGIEHQRECRLDAANIVDFKIDDVVIEVKIKSPRTALYRQIERYCEFNEVKALILVTNVPTGMPAEVKGKPVYVVSLAKAWL